MSKFDSDVESLVKSTGIQIQSVERCPRIDAVLKSGLGLGLLLLPTVIAAPLALELLSDLHKD